MKKIAPALAGIAPLSLLAACIATHHAITGPDGTENQIINCPKGIFFFTVDVCYKKARKVCNGNYTIINSTVENEGDKENERYSLLVKCEQKSP